MKISRKCTEGVSFCWPTGSAGILRKLGRNKNMALHDIVIFCRCPVCSATSKMLEATCAG